MYISQFVFRIFVLLVVTMLSNTASDAYTNDINIENTQCVIESTKIVNDDMDLFVDEEFEKSDGSTIDTDESIDVGPTDHVSGLNTAQTEPMQKHEDAVENIVNGENDDGDITNRPDNDTTHDVVDATEPSSPHVETDISLPTNAVSDKNDTAKTDEVGEIQLPYDGDVAVPPDVAGNDLSSSVNQTLQVCAQHDFVLIKTDIDAEYELYNYVTDYYKCAKCDHTNTDTHIASANISDFVINGAEADIVNRVNELRVANGLNKLWVDDSWDEWANIRSIELESVYGHCRPSGEDWLYAIDNHYTIGENIASGQASGIAFYDAFYKSAQHKDLMLAEDAVGIAVSIYVNKDGTPYCAMVLIGAY